MSPGVSAAAIVLMDRKNTKFATGVPNVESAAANATVKRAYKSMPWDKSKYPKDWAKIRAAILQRANNRCELCGVENHAFGYRDADGNFWRCEGIELEVACNDRKKIIQIVLTIAHWHDPSNLLVSCVYGQSRSAAVALAVTCIMAEREDEPIEIYQEYEARISPNKCLVNLFRKRIDPCSGTLLMLVAQHFNDHET